MTKRLPHGKELNNLASEYTADQSHGFVSQVLKDDAIDIDKKNFINIVRWLKKKGY